MAGRMLGLWYADAPAAGNSQFLHRLLGTTSPAMPMPQDYNVMQRLIGIRPPKPQNTHVAEWDAFISLTNAQRTRALAIQTKLDNHASSTLLAKYSITQGCLKRYMNAGPAANPTRLDHLLSNMNKPYGGHAAHPTVRDSVFATMVWTLSDSWLGTSRPQTLFAMWQPHGERGESPVQQVTNAFLALTGDDHHPPEWGSPFAVLNLIPAIPDTWCLSAKGGSYDLTHEVVSVGAPANHGWYARAGCRGYSEVACSQLPFVFEPYGGQVLNMMAQRIRPPAAFDLRFSTTPELASSTDALWENGVNQAAWEPTWDADLLMYRPNSFLTYDWANGLIMAPQMTVGLNDAIRAQWAGNSTAKLAGIVLPDKAIETAHESAGRMAEPDLPMFAGLALSGTAREPVVRKGPEDRAQQPVPE